MTKKSDKLLAECACFDLRRATRAVSRLYDHFLRDAGLNITQFSLLRLIHQNKDLSVSTLARYMVMDRTSITRALVPLERGGFISSHQGADKRTRLVALTKKGHQVVKDAEPRWQKAQQTLMEAIGNQPWAAMRDLLRDTTRLVRHKIADDLAETS